jgi:Glyoxalase-like domain
MMELDHVAVAGETLAAAQAHVEAALEVSLQQGGEHDVFFTHNMLLGLEEGLYLEAIAINPDGAVPKRARWFDLDRFSGAARLSNWICRCTDLDATLAALPDGFGAPVSLQRGDLRWRMAVPESGILPYDNCAPALIEWEGAVHPAARLDQKGCRMTGLTVRHPQAAELAQLLAPHLQGALVAFETGSAGLEARFDVAGQARVLR